MAFTKYGLIGYPLSHSFSPKYFAEKFMKEGIEDVKYDLFPLERIDTVTSLIKKLDGFNVTIPYKESIIPFLDQFSEEALRIGAVNCVKIVDGVSTGYNTDYYGFTQSIVSFLGANIEGVKAIVLGQGGAAKAINVALEDLKIPYVTISRTRGDLTYEELTDEILLSSKLIINTTSLGMVPNVNLCPPINYDVINDEYFLYDVIYNPEKTLFLTHGSDRKAKTMNGLSMLHLQADKSWHIWTNK